MRCFVHPANEAVGVCKNCSRGLCTQCAAEVEDSLACKGRCEGKVAELNQLLRRAPDSHRTAALTHRRSGITAVAIGMMFCAMGGLFVKIGHDDFTTTMGYLFVAMGAVYALNGLFVIRTARRYDFPASAGKPDEQGNLP
jgi:hypothetical protein